MSKKKKIKISIRQKPRLQRAIVPYETQMIGSEVSGTTGTTRDSRKPGDIFICNHYKFKSDEEYKQRLIEYNKYGYHVTTISKHIRSLEYL